MRWLFALMVLAGLVPEARADRWPCDREVHVMPQRGTTRVPRNARIWIAGRAPWSYTLTTALGSTTTLEPHNYTANGTVIDLRPELDNGEHYTLRDPNGAMITTFLVERDSDHEAPPVPEIVGQHGHDLDIVVRDDTAILRVEQRIGDRVVATDSRLTTGLDANGSDGCSSLVTVTAPCVRVTAIDLAGNSSAWTERCTEDQVTPVMLVTTPPDRDNPRGVLAVAFIIALVVGIFVVFAPEIDMGWLRRRTTGDALLPAAARQLAATVARKALARATGVLLAGAIALAMIGATATLFVGLGLALALSRQLWVFTRAHRMMRLLDRDGIATLHGDHVLRVHAGSEASWLVCSQRQLAIATERVLPLARVLAR
ncbi:MAG: hypothetical protein ABI867_33880 [Kofleriaceae bacterium]